MAYRIAVGSSDGINIDLKFGEVEKFIIYEVDNSEYKKLEIRSVTKAENQTKTEKEECSSNGCESGGCSGNGHGCSGPSDVTDRVLLIDDCRCVVCAKIGFQAQKQFERKAISVFDIECKITDALDKITAYYEKVDGHKSLR